MKIYEEPSRQEWEELCRRPSADSKEIESTVAGILERVRTGGDEALYALARELDGVRMETLRMSSSQINEACDKVDKSTKAAIDKAFDNIYAFHKAEMPKRMEMETSPGVRCVRKPLPIGRIGLYIPGGTAPLFSTVLMLGIPSMIAGCPVRILCTPPSKDGSVCPELLYAATKCGIKDIFLCGGAQAIAAMSYGTQTIPAVDKIFGPGNRYVTTAKKLVSAERTAIDMPAGPSEVMVLADSTAVPSYVASDLLSQAEHGRDSQVMLVCTSRSIASSVLDEVDRQAALLPRGEFIKSSLGNSLAVVLQNPEDMIAFANTYAPEHLIVSTANAAELSEKATSAGSIFIGNFSPESAGDYASGTNHTLPTSGWAHSYSGVSTESFIRWTTIQEITPAGLKELSDCIVTMAEAEGLHSHANAVRVRMAECSNAAEQNVSPKQLARPNILAMEPYSTARDEYKGNLGVFLDANESPYENGCNRYPDPRQKELKKKISSLKGIPSQNIFIGNGSDEAIDLVFRIFCEPGRDNAVCICPSYGMYKVAAQTNDIEIREVLLKDDFDLPVERLLSACDAFTKVMFICSPNNPTGNAFEKERILELASGFRGILVVDEAYGDFSSKGSVALASERIIVLQTLSKAWGMAGLRVGLAIADKDVIALMSNVKYPYNISKTVQQTALKMLDTALDPRVQECISERSRLIRELSSIGVVKKVFPSDANFLLVRFDNPDDVYTLLCQKGIIVRNRSRVPMCQGCLRISIGTVQENDKLIETLKAL